MIGVYLIRNTINGKVYVGSSIDIADRKIHHFSDARCNRHANSYFQNAFNKYGESNFEFMVLEETTMNTLIAREQYWMDYYDACNRKRGYNISPIADHPSPWIHKKHHSKETIRKMSLAKKGKVFSKEHRKNLSLSHKKLFENGYVHPNKGKKWSAEAIKKRDEIRRRNKNGKW